MGLGAHLQRGDVGVKDVLETMDCIIIVHGFMGRNCHSGYIKKTSIRTCISRGAEWHKFSCMTPSSEELWLWKLPCMVKVITLK